MSELQNISFKELQEFTLEFRDLIFRLPFQIPQDFIYLARAVGILAGMCTGLDPEFNVWEHLVPYAEKLISEEVFQDRYFWIDEVKLLFGSIFALPTKINAVLTKIDKGEITYESPQILLHMKRLERALHQITAVILFLTFSIVGIELFFAGMTRIAYPLFFLAGFTIIWILFFNRG